MKLILSLLFSLALSLSSFSQNGVYLYGFMENAPSSSVQIDVTVYTDSSMTQAVLFTEPSGNIQTQWFDLPTGEDIQFIEAGFYNCQTNYTFQSWNAFEFDNLIDIPLFLNYCADSTLFGCTDPEALNYNPQATHDDGSCEYATTCELNEVSILITTQSWGNEVSWTLLHDSLGVAGGGSYGSNSAYSSTWCLEDGCYTFEMFDTFGDGWNGSTFQIVVDGVLIQNGTLLSGSYGSVSFGINQEGCMETPPVSGCTDPEALNYNPFATIDDGSCVYATPAENDLCINAVPLIAGVTTVINNSNAFQNEGIWGECWGFGQGEGEQTSVWYTFTTPSYPASIHLEAVYDGSNTLTDTQFGVFEECGGEMTYCDGNAGEGLMSALDFECGELAENTTYLLIVDGWNGDSGTCFLQYEVDSTCATDVLGCTDPFAINYNPLATENDGSCIYETECTEVTIVLDSDTDLQADWLLYSDNGYFNGGSYVGPDFPITDCLEDGCYTIQMGTNDSIYSVAYSVIIDNQVILMGEINNSQPGNFSIGVGCDSTNVVYGCTDPEALNYNPAATEDDGSCEYTMECDLNQIFLVISTQSWGSEISWNLLNADSISVASGSGYDSNIEYVSQWCLADGCYTLAMYDTFGDGWNGGSFELLLNNGDILAYGALGTGNYGSVSFGINQEGCVDTLPIYGCTDPEALNYNPEATQDDGSCQYENSCTDVVITLDDNAFGANWYLTSASGYFSTGHCFASVLDIFQCLEDGCYTFQLDSNITDVNFNVFVNNQIIASGVLGSNDIAEFQIGSGCDSTNVVYGCTDVNAINYNPEATNDDGSCMYQFECSIDFFVIPDSTGEDVIWIMPTDNILAAAEVLWDFGDGTTSTDLFPSHEYIGDGPFTLCLTASFESPDGSSCSITYCAVLTGEMVGGPGFTSSEGGFTINVISDGTSVGLKTQDFISDLSLWPNPTSNQLNIQFNSLNSDIQTVVIMDITGKIIFQKQLINKVGRVVESIDVANLSSGVYLFKLSSADQVETRRFIIAQ